MWHEAANLILIWHLSWRGMYLWQEGMILIKYETRKWALHSLCGPCPSSLDISQDPRWEWDGMWISGGWRGNRSVMGTLWFTLQPPLGCECLLPQHWASCQSEETWEIMKAQPHKLSGCVSTSLWRGRWNFLYLPITVGWEGRLSPWWTYCVLSGNSLTKARAHTSDQRSSEPHSEKGIGRMGKNWFFGQRVFHDQKTLSPKLHFLRDEDVWLWKSCWIKSLLRFNEYKEKPF